MTIRGNRFISNLYWRLVLKNPRFRRFLATLIVPDEDVDIDLLGAPLRINKRQEIGYWNAYKKSQDVVLLRDEEPAILSLALILEPQDTFIDVGANVGLYSSCLSKLQSVYPNMKFYAFEANAHTATRLGKSLGKRNVEIFQLALSDKAAELEFVHGFSSAVFRAKNDARYAFQIDGAVERIPTKRLDSIPIDGHSIVIKLDVEGMEKDVIEGASQFFTDGRIKAVYLDGYEDVSLPEFFRLNGFSLFNGRTLEPHAGTNTDYSLLAIHQSHLQRFNKHRQGISKCES